MGAGVDVPGDTLVGGTVCDVSVCVDSGVLVAGLGGTQDANMKASTKPIFVGDFGLILME